MHLHHPKVGISTTGATERIKESYSKDTKGCMSKAQTDNASKITLSLASLQPECAKKHFFFAFFSVAAQKYYRFLLQSFVLNKLVSIVQSINMKLNEKAIKENLKTGSKQQQKRQLLSSQHAHMKKRKQLLSSWSRRMY